VGGSNFLDLSCQLCYLILSLIVLFLGKVVPFFFLFFDQAFSLPERLVQNLNEYFENVVEKEGPDERAMLILFSKESQLLFHFRNLGIGG
jgi:hypothetical protein